MTRPNTLLALYTLAPFCSLACQATPTSPPEDAGVRSDSGVRGDAAPLDANTTDGSRDAQMRRHDANINWSALPACRADEFGFGEYGATELFSATVKRCCVANIGPTSECRMAYAQIATIDGREFSFAGEHTTEYLNTHHNWADSFRALRDNVELRWEAEPHNGIGEYRTLRLWQPSGRRVIISTTRYEVDTFAQ